MDILLDTQPLTKGEATRQRIIETAYHLFLEHGYHGTSMRLISVEAQITMGGIYNHFSGKEAIWEAVIMAKHPYHKIIPLINSAEGDTIAEFVRHAATSLVTELGQRPDLLYLIFIELIEFDGAHLSTVFHAVMPDLIQIGKIFAQKKGRLRAIPFPILARSFGGLFFSYYVTDLIMPPEARKAMTKDPLAEFINIYLYGILDETEPKHV